MHDITRRIERRLAEAGGVVSSSQLEQLSDYLLLLERWNQRMNLTSLDDEDAAIDRLIAEPVIASASIDPVARLLVDVGTGGGSPAIPLKIMRPDVALTMVEIKTRKSVFLREVARHLRLTSTDVVTARFEDVCRRPDLAGHIDTISSRAVRVGSEELRVFGTALRSGGQQLWFLSGSQTAPVVPLPLAVERDVPLVESTRSRLLVIRKP